MNRIHYLVHSRQAMTIEWMAECRIVSTSITNIGLGSWMAVTHSPLPSLRRLLLPQMACNFSISTWTVNGGNVCPSAASLSSLVGEWEWDQESPESHRSLHPWWVGNQHGEPSPACVNCFRKRGPFHPQSSKLLRSHMEYGQDHGWRVRQKWVLTSAPCSDPY